MSAARVDELVEAAGLTGELDHFCRTLGIMVRLRALGLNGRRLAKFCGIPNSTMARVWMPAIDRLSHLGQDGWDDPSKIKDALAGDQIAVSYLGQKERSPRPPRDSEAARFMVGLASLAALANRDPNDIVADMEPELQDEAIRLVAMIAPWLAHIGAAS